VTREVVTRAPTRIDLGGGWTDVPPYCDREGGFVCNVAINRYAVARVSDAGDVRSDDDGPLVRAALRRAGLTHLHASIASDFPVAAGLGGSSAASAALLAAIAEWRHEPIDRTAIAEAGRAIEVEDLGIAGGRQDHYAATYGGALALTFTRATSVRRLALTDATRDALCARAVLVYTGQSRVSGDTITAVLGAYKHGDPSVHNALRRMRELAIVMADVLEDGDLDALGELLNEHWEHQRSLHPSIPTAQIDEIVMQSRAAGALGAKAMGASGGGCVLILCRDDGVDTVRRAVQPLGEVLDFRVDEGGVTVEGIR
jgi:D-glycero-alpha-D-manno-heptose-7-phosphate kinase